MTAGAIPLDEPSGCRAGCSRHAAFRPLVAGASWLAAVVAALAVAAVPFDAGESLCGMWGCFPPLPPLLAMHLLWAVVLAAAVWAVREWQPRLLRPVGGLVLAVAALAAGLSLGSDLAEWFRWIPDEDAHLWPRRVAYTLATKSDRPLLQSLAAGAAAVWLGRNRRAPAGANLGEPRCS